LHNFSTSGDGGNYPEGSMVVSSSGGIIYGTTSEGGPGDGTLFFLNITSGSAEYTVLYDFTSNGFYPQGGLVLDELNGLLYGTVASPNGGVFAYHMNTNKMTFLYSFTSTGGDYPYSGVVLSHDKTVCFCLYFSNGFCCLLFMYLFFRFALFVIQTLYGITSTSGSNGEGPAVFYALQSCYTAPPTTTHPPTTTKTTLKLTKPPTTTPPQTTTTSTTTTSIQPASTTTTTQPPTTTKSTPKAGSIYRFDGSLSMIVSFILSLSLNHVGYLDKQQCVC